MLPDQRAAGHLVMSHGAPLSRLAVHAPHGHVAIVAQGGDGNDERHLRQQLQQVERHLRQQLPRVPPQRTGDASHTRMDQTFQNFSGLFRSLIENEE